jgi:hypothetical protein
MLLLSQCVATGYLRVLNCAPCSCLGQHPLHSGLACALTDLMLRRSELDLSDNAITSFDGAQFLGKIE